jgi:hypothetical protein
VPQSSLAHEQYSQGNGATPPSPLADDENDQIPAMATLALPATSGKIPVSRKIEIECRADGLMIPGRTVYLSIPNAASFRGAVSTLVGEVEREVARWGPPGLTFRWQPKLLCIVRADGLEMYYGLRAALVGSSIDIEHLILAEDEMDWSDSLFLRHLERAKFDTQRFME